MKITIYTIRKNWKWFIVKQFQITFKVIDFQMDVIVVSCTIRCNKCSDKLINIFNGYMFALLSFKNWNLITIRSKVALNATFNWFDDVYNWLLNRLLFSFSCLGIAFFLCSCLFFNVVFFSSFILIILCCFEWILLFKYGF